MRPSDTAEARVPAGLPARPGLATLAVAPGRTPGRPPLVSTGLAALDELLGGGFPRGRISELVGPRTSGRTSVLLRSLARATAGGALAALVDVADGLDPASAAAVGVVLPRLLWVRCGGRLELGVKAADIVVRGGRFDVVAVDLGDLAPAPLARVPAAAFVRLQRGVEATPTVLLFAAPRRVAGSLAAVAVALRPRRVAWAPGGPRLLAGLTTEARLVRGQALIGCGHVDNLFALGPGASGLHDA
jgi:recombination protein RecA